MIIQEYVTRQLISVKALWCASNDKDRHVLLPDGKHCNIFVNIGKITIDNPWLVLEFCTLLRILIKPHYRKIFKLSSKKALLRKNIFPKSAISR